MRPIDVLNAVRPIADAYLNVKPKIDFPINLKNLTQVVKDFCGLSSLEIIGYDVPFNPLAARLSRFENSAKIQYSGNLNICWSRFVIVKELVHLITGAQSNFTDDPMALGTQMLLKHQHGSIDVAALLTTEPKGIQIEETAWLGAMYLLIPPPLDKRLYKIQSEGKSYLQIAEMIKVPQGFVKIRLTGALPIFAHFDNLK